MKDSTKIRKPLKLKPAKDLALMLLTAIAVYGMNELIVTVNEWLTLSISVVFVLSLLYIVRHR